MEELEDIYYPNNDYTTGDFYLDNFLEEESSNFNSVNTTEPEVEDLEDEDAEFDFSNELLYDLLNSEDYTELVDSYGAEGILQAGRNKVGNVHADITKLESGGRYDAFNKAGGGSGAVGKYQFRWNIWKDDIQRETGIDNIQDFLRNPEAQESFYNDYYVPKKVMPWVSQTKRHLNTNISNDQLIKLYHFRGPQGALNYLKGNVGNRPEEYNMSISGYTGIRPGSYLKNGGWVYAQLGTLNTAAAERNVNSYSSNFMPVNPPDDITSSVFQVKNLNLGAPTVAQNPILEDIEKKQNSQNSNLDKIGSIAANVAGGIQTGMGIATSIKDAKGKGISNALSGVSAIANTRLQREREQADLQNLYETLQTTYNDQVTDDLGQTRNIWT